MAQTVCVGVCLCVSQAAGFARIPSMGQSMHGMHGMHGLPLGLPPGQHTAASMGMAGKDTAGHMSQMGMAQTPAGRVPNMDMGWRGPGGDIFRAPSSGLPSMIGQMSAEAAAQGNFHWDPATLGGAGNMMDMWGGMHVMPPGLHGLGFGHEHMPMMPQAMYAAHGLQMPPSLVGRPQMPDDDGGKGKKGRGKNKNKSKNSDAEVVAALACLPFIALCCRAADSCRQRLLRVCPCRHRLCACRWGQAVGASKRLNRRESLRCRLAPRRNDERRSARAGLGPVLRMMGKALRNTTSSCGPRGWASKTSRAGGSSSKEAVQAPPSSSCWRSWRQMASSSASSGSRSLRI